MEERIFLFLDFDGVLHRVGGEVFDPQYLANLESALRDHPAVEIVVTSSWREVHPLEMLQDFLGPELGKRVIGITPVIDEPFLKFCRYNECLAFLESIGQSDANWVAVDDEIGNYPPDASVILTNPREALSDEAAFRLRTILETFRQKSENDG